MGIMALSCFKSIVSRCPAAFAGLRQLQSVTRGFCNSSQNELVVNVEPLEGENEGISMLTLNRPAAKNALNRQLIREFNEALSNLRQERSTRCVVVRSAVQGVFCSGADLKERSVMTQRETAEFVSTLRKTFSDLEALPMPTIAAVDGVALGGGAEMTLACDIRVCGRSAAFGWPETHLAIIPGAGGTQRLPRIVGLSLALELLFTARRIAAPEAHMHGLVNTVVDDGHAVEAALDMARSIKRGGPIALRMAKAAVRQGLEVDAASGLKIEELCYDKVIPTKDRLEGLLAFKEKRLPNYTGE